MEKLIEQRETEPDLLSYKGVMYRTSGKYLCDREVVAVVTDTTKALLKSLGYPVSVDSGDLGLSGELLRLDSTPLMGFWSGELESVIQLTYAARTTVMAPFRGKKC